MNKHENLCSIWPCSLPPTISVHFLPDKKGSWSHNHCCSTGSNPKMAMSAVQTSATHVWKCKIQQHSNANLIISIFHWNRSTTSCFYWSLSGKNGLIILSTSFWEMKAEKLFYGPVSTRQWCQAANSLHVSFLHLQTQCQLGCQYRESITKSQ